MLGPRGDKQRPGFAFSLCLRSEPEELPLLENEVPEPEAPVAAWALGAKNAHSCADGHGRGQPRFRKTNLLRAMGMGINQPFSGLESKGKVPGSPYRGCLPEGLLACAWISPSMSAYRSWKQGRTSCQVTFRYAPLHGKEHLQPWKPAGLVRVENRFLG